MVSESPRWLGRLKDPQIDFYIPELGLFARKDRIVAFNVPPLTTTANAVLTNFVSTTAVVCSDNDAL